MRVDDAQKEKIYVKDLQVDNLQRSFDTASTLITTKAEEAAQASSSLKGPVNDLANEVEHHSMNLLEWMNELESFVQKAFKKLDFELTATTTVITEFCKERMDTEDLSFKIIQDFNSKHMPRQSSGKDEEEEDE